MDRETSNHIPFEKVCQNRELYVPKISDGNPILRDIINCCIDQYKIDRSIGTYECCQGHDGFEIDTYVMFNIAYSRPEYIYSIINAINAVYRTTYAIGQERLNNTILLDVRLEYSGREAANEFLSQVKKGLEHYKVFKSGSPEVSKMVSLLKDVHLTDYQVMLQKASSREYDAMLYKDRGSDVSLVNRRYDFIETFDQAGILNLRPEDFRNTGIQKTIRRR